MWCEAQQRGARNASYCRTIHAGTLGLSLVGLAAALMAATAHQPPALVTATATAAPMRVGDEGEATPDLGAAIGQAAPRGAAPLLRIAPPAPSPVPSTMYPDAIPTMAAQADTAVAREPAGAQDIVVTARQGHAPGDPFEAVNEQSFKLTQKADGAVVAPASRVYRSIVPTPVRDGLGNFFRNLHEPDNFLNFVAQHKIGKAAETVARFAINSTIGLLGLFDIARRKPFKLPQRFNSLSNTLGYYGVGSGPFFFVPLVGPTTLRDFFGNAVDGLVLPQAVGKPFTSPAYTIPSSAFRSLEHRVKIDDKLNEIKRSTNPYAAARDYYLTRRQAEIDHLKGKDSPKADGDTFPGGTPPPPAPTPANDFAPTPAPPAAPQTGAITPLDIPPGVAAAAR